MSANCLSRVAGGAVEDASSLIFADWVASKY